MQRISRALIPLMVLVGCYTTVASQEAPLGPRAEQLMTLVGTWTVEGTVKAVEATGETSAGPVSYVQTGALVNDGTILQVRRVGTDPTGDVEEFWLYRYNAITKTYQMDATTRRSVLRNFTLKIDGPSWVYDGGNIGPSGVRVFERMALTFATDMKSASVRSEHSADGKTWFERLTGTYRKQEETATPVAR